MKVALSESQIFVLLFFFFSSRRRHTRLQGDWSSDVCSSDLTTLVQCVKGRKAYLAEYPRTRTAEMLRAVAESVLAPRAASVRPFPGPWVPGAEAYRALDLRPGAPQDEILGSYMRLRRPLRSDSPPLAPLDCETERRATAAEVENAYRTLSRNLSSAAPRPSRPAVSASVRRFRGAFPGV